MNDPLVLLPGMMCDARLFAPQIAALSSAHPVMVVPLTGSTSIETLAEKILLRTPPRFALAGLSMGGIVAMEIIRQAPARVTRLALFDTNPMADAPEKATIRDLQIERVSQGKLTEIMRDEMKPNYLSDGENKGEILELCMKMAQSLGPDVFISQSIALKNRPDQYQSLKNIKVPTLIACGEHDVLCPIEKHQLMHDAIEHSRLCILPNAGHLPTLEQAELTSREISEWLEVG